MQDACRVGYGEIISDASISDFRKLMLLELHQRKLLTQFHQQASYLSSIMLLNMWKLTTLDMHKVKLIAL